MKFEEYRIMYEAEDTHWWYRGMRGVMFELLGLNRKRNKSPHVLDAGCGTGGNLAALRRAGYDKIDGFDLNEPAIFFCRKRGLLNVRQGSIMDIPFESDAFDIVISCDVLNDAGTKNENRALEELYRVLRPGGRLFLNLPAFNFLRSEHDRATDVARRYTKAEITRKLKQGGFEVKRVTYWNAFLFPAVLLVRIVRGKGFEDTDKPARSDIVQLPAPLNYLLTLITRAEAFLIRWIDLPWGSSVAAVATKPKAKSASAKGREHAA